MVVFLLGLIQWAKSSPVDWSSVGYPLDKLPVGSHSGPGGMLRFGPEAFKHIKCRKCHTFGHNHFNCDKDIKCRKCDQFGHRHFNCPNHRAIMLFLARDLFPSLDLMASESWRIPDSHPAKVALIGDNLSWRRSKCTSATTGSPSNSLWSRAVPSGPWRNLNLCQTPTVMQSISKGGVAIPANGPANEPVSKSQPTNPFLQADGSLFTRDTTDGSMVFPKDNFAKYLEYLGRKGDAPNYHWYGISFTEWLKQEAKRLAVLERGGAVRCSNPTTLMTSQFDPSYIKRCNTSDLSWSHEPPAIIEEEDVDSFSGGSSILQRVQSRISDGVKFISSWFGVN